MAFQIRDRVWIRLPFSDGQLRKGTIYAICVDRRWPYHVLPDGEESGVAYTEKELASDHLPLDQVVPTRISNKDYRLFKSVMGL